MREPTSIQSKIWKAYGKIAKKLPTGVFKVYRPTQFQINPIQDVYLRGEIPVYIEEKKSPSNPFGGLTEYILYLNAQLSPNFIMVPGDYLWDQINHLTYVVTKMQSYDEIIGINLPNTVSISRTTYVETLNGTEAQLTNLVESLPCVVEFGAFNMGGVVPASSPAQAGYDQVKITTAITPELIDLGDVITHKGVEMSILSLGYTPDTPGTTIIAKVMG